MAAKGLHRFLGQCAPAVTTAPTVAGSIGGASVARMMRSPEILLRSAMRLITCRNARALASMMSVLTARPEIDLPWNSASTLRLALGVLADRDAAHAVILENALRCR